MEQNRAIFAKEKEKKRRIVITISVLSGASGHHGRNARLLVVKENGQEQELVTDLPLDFHLKGNLCYGKYRL